MSGKRKPKHRKQPKPKVRVGFPYYQQIWWDALCTLRNQLSDHYLYSKPDQLRFQNRRLFENLMRRIEAEGKDHLKTMGLCYSLVTVRWLHLGYDEPRRLHFEEMGRAQQRRRVDIIQAPGFNHIMD